MRYTSILRIMFSAYVLALMFLLFGPSIGFEDMVHLSDRDTRTLGYLFLAVMMMVAFPSLRKWQIGLACVSVVGLAHLIEAVSGEPQTPFSWLSDVVGIACAIIVSHLGEWRLALKLGAPRSKLIRVAPAKVAPVETRAAEQIHYRHRRETSNANIGDHQDVVMKIVKIVKRRA